MQTSFYPFTFQPVLKEKIWGGQKLNSLFQKGNDAQAKMGESWEIADLPEGQSMVKSGDLKGKSLHELIEMNPEALLGKKVYERFGKNFPLLIKFIDAAKDLSIQVHPTDETSPTGTGKTEMWYIMQADPGALLTVGFNQKITKEEYDKRIEDLSIEEVMDTHVVTEGDSFFINAGRIHAIGGGVLLAEIQQTSDVTYRVYDYNRKDDSGNLRDLHVSESREVLDFELTQDFKLEYDREASNTPQTLKHHTYFKTDWLKIEDDKYQIDRNDSFTILIVVSGSLTYEGSGGSGSLKAGHTLLVPAENSGITISAEACEVLEVYL
ncbi:MULTISPECIES: type I phosphomannose isomerase catalytic subunit [unclassified Leeuwenhoekiella]|uniref:type I phosphomannose isomerase catalytic subunit n=1 Tax=unclassified Leeuwenhoekiella TaxID=2615029 RepID=UPI000C6B24CA|nr:MULTISPECIES: type I phosphomannose isomerase catalytic subunit [unclassified Leeuwenhoekiella]MAW97155.1 mannose-6-phosphate isomerase [Leeuwenhoekiella sp.]MBA82671.1 mannose-6-phosphate isomerase [Leeuwenhoekiella sp.]|tara:strand:- start:46709 stop:47677 length:969 start_codon:yes stop_codon:yes gene_type:complete